MVPFFPSYIGLTSAFAPAVASAGTLLVANKSSNTVTLFSEPALTKLAELPDPKIDVTCTVPAKYHSSDLRMALNYISNLLDILHYLFTANYFVKCADNNHGSDRSIVAFTL